MQIENSSKTVQKTHITKGQGHMAIPLWYPDTPDTPKRGKGLSRVRKSLPLPLPPHTPHQYAGGIAYPCHSLAIGPKIKSFPVSDLSDGLMEYHHFCFSHQLVPPLSHLICLMPLLFLGPHQLISRLIFSITLLLLDIP
jgi:hypothetical protein